MPAPCASRHPTSGTWRHSSPRTPRFTIRELASGHDAMIDVPQDVADLLLSSAETGARRQSNMRRAPQKRPKGQPRERPAFRRERRCRHRRCRRTNSTACWQACCWCWRWSSLDANIVGPALPLISSEFGALDSLTWVLTHLPAHQHRRDAALWQAQRHVWPQAAAHHRGAAVPRRISVQRPRPKHEPADPRSRHPGSRRRRADDAHPRSPCRIWCRRGGAAATRALFGAVFTIASLAGPAAGPASSPNSGPGAGSFYVNLPLGAAALTLLWMGLPPGVRTTSHRIECSRLRRHHGRHPAAC